MRSICFTSFIIAMIGLVVLPVNGEVSCNFDVVSNDGSQLISDDDHKTYTSFSSNALTLNYMNKNLPNDDDKETLDQSTNGLESFTYSGFNSEKEAEKEMYRQSLMKMSRERISNYMELLRLSPPAVDIENGDYKKPELRYMNWGDVVEASDKSVLSISTSKVTHSKWQDLDAECPTMESNLNFDLNIDNCLV